MNHSFRQISNPQRAHHLLEYDILKTHVSGFFDTDFHEVSWHFATQEAVRPSGF